MNALLGGFGLARTFYRARLTIYNKRDRKNTRLHGFYIVSHRLGEEAKDVYAFGVLVWEVVSGRKPGNQNECNSVGNSMVNWIWGLYIPGRTPEDAD